MDKINGRGVRALLKLIHWIDGWPQSFAWLKIMECMGNDLPMGGMAMKE